MSIPEFGYQFEPYNKICIKGDMIMPFVGTQENKSIYFDKNDDTYLGIVMRKMPDNQLVFSNNMYVDANLFYTKIDMEPVLDTDELKDTELYYSKMGEYIGNKSHIRATVPKYKLVNKSTFVGGFYSYNVSDKKGMFQTKYPANITALVLQRNLGNLGKDSNQTDSVCDNMIYAQFKIVNGKHLPQDEEAIKEFINDDYKFYMLDGKKIFTMNEKTEYTGYRE